jgi:hypothetical protein
MSSVWSEKASLKASGPNSQLEIRARKLRRDIRLHSDKEKLRQVTWCQRSNPSPVSTVDVLSMLHIDVLPAPRRLASAVHSSGNWSRVRIDPRQ